jgi:tRNA dimethylallyltransferase
LALELAARLPIEIISMDSAQVYREMDIGTAKPGATERASVPHHLIDILAPDAAYSAGQFRRDCLELMAQIRARGRLPLIVGGTMLYLKAVRDGLHELPAGNAALRAELDERATRLGWPALHAELAKVDAATAARLRPNDRQRIQRALEVYLNSGTPLSRWTSAASAAPSAIEVLALHMPRERLHRRIEQRFHGMLESGLIDEVRGLLASYQLSPEKPSMRAVGYRQVLLYLTGVLSRDELLTRGIAATRQLAKRQMTWIRAAGYEQIDSLATVGGMNSALARLRELAQRTLEAA